MLAKLSEITQCNGPYAVQGHSRSLCRIQPNPGNPVPKPGNKSTHYLLQRETFEKNCSRRCESTVDQAFINVDCRQNSKTNYKGDIVIKRCVA